MIGHYPEPVGAEPVWQDAEDVWDDTPEGERRPQRPRGRADAELRHDPRYPPLRAQFLFLCKTTRMPDGTYGLPCWLCNKKLDYNLNHRNRLAPTVDHVVPVRLAPDRFLDTTNWKPAHRKCNEERARKIEDELMDIGVPSRKW